MCGECLFISNPAMLNFQCDEKWKILTQKKEKSKITN